MKLYWRYKKDGKWTWRAATKKDLQAYLSNGWYAQKEEEE